jgi:hypothetical protein
MRTTLTLDDDVAARLRTAVKRQGRPFRAVVNDALRAGLARIDERTPPRKPHHTTGFNLGSSLVGSLDNVDDILQRVDGERRR